MESRETWFCCTQCSASGGWQWTDLSTTQAKKFLFWSWNFRFWISQFFINLKKWPPLKGSWEEPLVPCLGKVRVLWNIMFWVFLGIRCSSCLHRQKCTLFFKASVTEVQNHFIGRVRPLLKICLIAVTHRPIWIWPLPQNFWVGNAEKIFISDNITAVSFKMTGKFFRILASLAPGSKNIYLLTYLTHPPQKKNCRLCYSKPAYF